MEGNPQAPRERPGRGGAVLAIGSTAGEDHLAGREAVQHVFDRLHDVLVTKARRRLDPAPGQRGHSVDQVALGALPSRPDVRGPALEETLTAGRDKHDLGRGLIGPAPEVVPDRFGQGRLVQRAAEHDQDATAEVRRDRRHDRLQGRLANGEDDDRRRGQGADRHAQSRAADVEAADDRERDRSHDRRQLPGRQGRLAHPFSIC